MIYWIISIAVIVILVIMRKRIVRFLRKLGLWKKAQEFKEKPIDPIPVPKEPEPPVEPKFIPIEPNQETDLAASINSIVSDKNEILFKEGKYNLERSHVSGRDKTGAVHFEGRKNLNVKGGEFYTKAPATEFRTDVSHRRHFRILDSQNVEFENVVNKGSNTIDRGLIGSPGHTPAFWGETQVEGGRTIGAPPYRIEWEMEHGVDVRYSKNITFKNCEAYGMWGDGFYASHSDNVKFLDCKTYFTGRQGIGISNGMTNVLIDGYEAQGCARASIDLEPYSGGVIDGVEIRNSYLKDGHIAAGGRGMINNVNFHHNIHRSQIIGLGKPAYYRNNWVIEDNESIGGHGSPMPFVRVEHTKNVKINRNKYDISKTQGRFAVLVKGCSGLIEVVGNDFISPSIIKVIECPEGTEVIVKDNNEGCVVVIEINGITQIIGDNPELLKLI